MGKGVTYKNLAKKYDDFGYPVAEFVIKGKKFTSNKENFLIDGLEIELCSGFEASMAEFYIYNCYDPIGEKFLADKLSSYVELGAIVSIKTGYLSDIREIFQGFVAGMDYGCENDGLPYVKVTAMDLKGIMMANSYSMQLKSKSYGEAVREILQKPVYGNLAEKLLVSDTPDKRESQKVSSDTVEMTAESDYEFVVKAARRFNYDFFINNKTVYFRKAKGQREAAVTLGIHKGIRNFNISYSINSLVESVEVRSVDPGTGKLLTVSKKRTGKISTGSMAAKLLKKSKKVSIDPTAVSQEQANARCESLLETISYRFGEITCECEGIPELVPGIFFKVDGLGDGVSNLFYIAKALHRMDEGGYRTQITGIADKLEETGTGGLT